MSFVEIIKTTVGVLLIITSGLISVLVLKQDTKESRISASNGRNTVSTETYWGKNKIRSEEGKKILATRILVFMFIIEVIAMNMLGK